MSLGAIVIMVVVVGLVMGGFVCGIGVAIRQESLRQRDGGGEQPQAKSELADD